MPSLASYYLLSETTPGSPARYLTCVRLESWRRLHDPQERGPASPRLSAAEQPGTVQPTMPCSTIPRGHRDPGARELSSTDRRILIGEKASLSPVQATSPASIGFDSYIALPCGSGMYSRYWSPENSFNRSLLPWRTAGISPFLRDRSRRISGDAYPGGGLRPNILLALCYGPRRGLHATLGVIPLIIVTVVAGPQYTSK